MSDKQLTANDNVELGVSPGSDVPNELLQNPGVLASLQDRLPFDGKLQAVAHYRSLPKVVKRRVKALKKLQANFIKLESNFYKELHDLELKYASQYQPFYDRRQQILVGNVEPNDEDCDWPSDAEDVDEATVALVASMRDKAKLANDTAQLKEGNNETVSVAANGSDQTTDDVNAVAIESTKGIDDFWLTVLNNVDIVSEIIQEHDQPILKHLQDIRVEVKDGEEAGFVLQFHFLPNEYFTNTVLTKQYFLNLEASEEDPFSYEGPVIERCRGCEIHWKKGKNVTVKVVKKVQKHKGRGEKRTVTKTVPNDSFFNFFNPEEQSVDEINEDDEDAEQLLQADFEIAHFLRERVIPRAVLYFTGEAIEDDDDFDEEEEEEEDDDDDEEDDSEADDGVESNTRRTGGANRNSNATTQGSVPDQQCKQQ